MPDYKKMYFDLAVKVADAIDILTKAQQQGESDYIHDGLSIVSLTDKFESVTANTNQKDTTV